MILNGAKSSSQKCLFGSIFYHWLLEAESMPNKNMFVHNNSDMNEAALH